MPITPEQPIRQVHGISKRFGDTLALDNVDFTLRPGEIHALLGENGAGKSTLMNIARGSIAPTSGALTVAGQRVAFRSPEDADRVGISMVHQHFLLVPTFTIAENLALADTRQRSLLLDTNPLAQCAQATAERLGWRLPPMNSPVGALPVGTQQRIEILRALMSDARILLFDEPTAVLAPPEIDELLEVLRALRAEGRSLVFVSHKLREVMAVCDRVTVLRRGRNVGTILVSDTNPADLARRMVGGHSQTDSSAARTAEEGRGDPAPAADLVGAGSPRPVVSSPITHAATATLALDASTVLSVTRLATEPVKDVVALQDISFTLQCGEILGVAGVDGNGQAELAQALTGLRPWTSGTVQISGQTVNRLHPSDLERLSIALVPPDRHREGLALTLSIADNLTLEAARLPRFRRGPFLDRPALRRFAAETAREFDVRAEDLTVPVSSLSGGNQQKVIIARALWRKPQLLVAVSPTRGLDVAATAYVHSRLRERQAEGGAILLISTELDEVLALSTRVAVLYEGRIIGIVPPDTPRETLGLMMGGKFPAEASHG